MYRAGVGRRAAEQWKSGQHRRRVHRGHPVLGLGRRLGVPNPRELGPPSTGLSRGHLRVQHPGLQTDRIVERVPEVGWGPDSGTFGHNTTAQQKRKVQKRKVQVRQSARLTYSCDADHAALRRQRWWRRARKERCEVTAGEASEEKRKKDGARWVKNDIF